MKNKLHKSNTLCHAELDSASHPVCHSVGVSINKTPTFQIAKLPNFQIFSLFFIFSSFFSNAQNYNWDWAVSGGGMQGADYIYDVKVGSDNNYYFIGSMHGTIGVQLNGDPVDVFNSSLGGEDIFLFSTNCEGQVRWSQAIGGNGSGDSAYNIALDSNNNVYVGALVGFATNPLYPVHFSPTEVLPVPTNPNTVSDGWKTSFIVKYDSNGDFVWKKAVQGDVNQNNFDSRIHDIVMDSQNKLHFIVVFAAGTHLDGLVNVPANTYQYYLVKFNTVTQQFDDVLLLPTTGQMEPQNTRFAYDETSNIYYISSIRESLMPFSYNNEPIINRSFVLAFRGFNSSVGTDGEEIWRREIYSDPNSSGAIQLNRVKSLAIDGNSDLYIGGILGWDYNLGTSVKIYDPSDTTTDYTFTPNAATLNMPFMAKFNNQGAVQWVKTPELDTNYTSNTSLSVGGIAFRGNEVAMGSSETYFKWDNLSLNRPQYYQPDATLLRFNKQTGATIAMHAIEGGGK